MSTTKPKTTTTKPTAKPDAKPALTPETLKKKAEALLASLEQPRLHDIAKFVHAISEAVDSEAWMVVDDRACGLKVATDELLKIHEPERELLLDVWSAAKNLFENVGNPEAKLLKLRAEAQEQLERLAVIDKAMYMLKEKK